MGLRKVRSLCVRLLVAPGIGAPGGTLLGVGF
jgi:hypothetical protein